ncbi:MAG: hypothetical protein AAFX50_09905, partial [Acidobacteriota bacterium]
DLADTEQLAAALLAGIARTYGLRWDADETQLAELAGVAPVRPWPSLAMAANALAVETLDGLPARFDWEGVNLDAALRIAAGVPVSGELPDAERAWRRLAALHGSALEHRVFEDEFLVQSISADKGLGLARDAGQTVLSVTGPDLSPILPQLEHPPEVLDALGRWAGVGRRLEVPTRPLTLNAWTGSVWRVEDLTTGAAAYVLTGGLNGGVTTEDPGSWVLDFLSDALAGPFSEQPNPDPLAGAEIVALPEGDRQQDTVGELLPTALTVRVTDDAGRPVEGAEVHFLSVAGGGTLISNQEDPITGVPVEMRSESELVVRTNALGLASAELELGTDTNSNATFAFQNPSDEYQSRAALHLIDAQVESHGGPLTIPRYLSALAFAGEVVEIRPLDGILLEPFSTPNTWVDTLYMEVLDEYGNPVSNEEVTFTIGEEQGEAECLAAPHDGTVVVEIGSCEVLIPEPDDCGDLEVATLSRVTGARVGVIIGSGPGITYEIVVSAADVEPFNRYYFLRQGEDLCEPVIGVRVLVGLGFSSPEGDRLSAAGLGQPYIPPVVADFQEWLGDEGIYVPKTMNSVDARKVGGGSVSPLTQITPSEYRGFATVGETPGLEQVVVDANYDDDRNITGALSIYALEPRILETVPPVLELSSDDRARTDLLIRYDVLPEDYRALTR